MVWFDTIQDLQYYDTPANGDCYCEPIIEPHDLILQAAVPSPGPNQFFVYIEVMSADGATVYENATQYFTWVAILGSNNQHYINLRAERFSPQMCAHSCFILRVTISIGGSNGIGLVKFKKYTERFCVDYCCALPDNIDILVDDPNGEYDPQDYGDEYFNI